jgi:hypothetical protein
MDHPNLRVGDDERRRVADDLQRHFVDGRLSSDELSDRVRQAMAARTQGDLDGVVHDLPALPPPASAPTLPPASEPTAAVPEPASLERAGAWDRRDVRANAVSYVLVMLLLVAIWFFTTPGGYFWPIWPMLGWGFAVAAHALARHRG